MLRPTLIAFAVGFSVSIAQYMPTLWLGAGRFPTLTTEAVALSSGGSNGILAARALWQLLLPLIIFCPDRVSRKMGRLCRDKDSANALREKCFATFTRKLLADKR